MKKFKIGRNKGNDVVINKPQISGEHLLITSDLWIEDLNSTGGVFVNNRRVRKTKISISDRIKLSNILFDVRQHFRIKNGVIVGLKDANDFSQEFLALKKVYEEYIKKEEELRKKLEYKVAVATTPFLLIPLVGVAISRGVSPLLTSKAKTKNKEAINALRYNLRRDYRCPNQSCRNVFGVTPWEEIAKDKNCPQCKCVWIKEDNL